MPIIIDERLPALAEIDEPNRQQSRRVERTSTPCGKCYRPLGAEDLCFADGRDAHRSCAEMWNYELLEGWEILKAQDAMAIEEARREADQAERSARLMGLALPTDRQEGSLWTPPSATPAAPVLTR